MALAKFQEFVVDGKGNVLVGASVNLYETGTTTEAQLYSDRAGETEASQPIMTDGNGQAEFYVVPGIYDLKAELGGVSVTLTDYEIGAVTLIDDTVTDDARVWSSTKIDGAIAVAVDAVEIFATQEADRAEAAADEAENARDAAQLTAGIYDDTTAGLAATSDGEYFSTPSATSDEFLILYRNDAGSATEIDSYPNADAVEKRVRFVPDIAALRALTGVQDGQRVSVTGYHPSSNAGGGEFVWWESTPKSEHNGETTISPTVPWDGNATTLPEFKAGIGETDPGGDGCFVALSPTPVERGALNSGVNLSEEVQAIAGQPDQMFAATDSDGGLLVAFQRGTRMTQYTMRPDADGLMQLKSAKIGPAVLEPGGIDRFNQVTMDGDFVNTGTNYYTTTVGDSFSGEFNGPGAFLHSYTSEDGGVWRFVVDQDPALTFDVSTYSDPSASPSALFIVSGLANKSHTFVATFVGDDPENPPASGTARGWLRYDPATPFTIEDAGVFKALGPSPNQFTVTLDGDYINSGQNYYTTTIGDSFDLEFVGEGFDFHHVGDSRGGVWEFVIDGGSPITVSTYGDGGVKTTRVVDGLANSTHSGVATFQGADPENPPSGGTARGWLRYDPETPVTGTSFPRIAGGTGELLSPTSILEWAISCRPVSEPEWETTWSPRHSGSEDISRDVSVTVSVDGQTMTSSLDGLTENYLPVRSVVVEQTYTNHNGADTSGDHPMWDGVARHEFLRTGACRFTHEFTPREDLYCFVGYSLMLGAAATANAINNGGLESFTDFSAGDTLSYTEISSGARAEYRGEGDRYMMAAQGITPAAVWRLDSIDRSDRLFYTNVRTDAVKTYVRSFWDEVLGAGSAYRVAVEYMLGEQ